VFIKISFLKYNLIIKNIIYIDLLLKYLLLILEPIIEIMYTHNISIRDPSYNQE